MEPKQIGQTADLKMAYASAVGEDSNWTLFSQQRKHNFGFTKNLPLQENSRTKLQEMRSEQ
jgi:nucleoside 2-deoxyribosyltransferase